MAADLSRRLNDFQRCIETRDHALAGSLLDDDFALDDVTSGTLRSMNLSDWLRVLLIGVVLLVASWALMIVLARRLPPGAAKDLATVLPACVTTIRRLRRDTRVPLRAKIVIAFAGLWVLSPIDLIPEFLPIIGPLDDVVVVALALRYAARQVPREALFDAWPAEPRILERLIPKRA